MLTGAEFNGNSNGVIGFYLVQGACVACFYADKRAVNTHTHTHTHCPQLRTKRPGNALMNFLTSVLIWMYWSPPDHTAYLLGLAWTSFSPASTLTSPNRTRPPTPKPADPRHPPPFPVNSGLKFVNAASSLGVAPISSNQQSYDATIVGFANNPANSGRTGISSNVQKSCTATHSK